MILVFSSKSKRQPAALAKGLFVDGTCRTVSNIFTNNYTIHSTIDDLLYPVFFVQMFKEQTPTFKRAFTAIRRYMSSFSGSRVVHVECQLAAINAFVYTFVCDVRICLFHKNKAVLRAVSRFGLAGAYNSLNEPNLQIWIRRLLSLPFLPANQIKRDFKHLFENEVLHGHFCVEDQSDE